MRIGNRIGVQFGGGQSWSRYWKSRSIAKIMALSHGATNQTCIVKTSGDGAWDGIAYEYSVDGTTWQPEIKTTGKTLLKTGLTASTKYYWRARLYKGTNYSPYTDIVDSTTSNDDRYIFTVDTTKAGSANNTFIFPTSSSTGVDCYIEWGDGTAEQHVTANTPQHIYTAPGTYQCKVRPIAPLQLSYFSAIDTLKLISTDNWGSNIWGDVSLMYMGCANMIGTFADNPNTMNVTDFTNFFRQCEKFNSPIRFDTSKAVSLVAVFWMCSRFNQDVSWIDSANCTDIHGLFGYCTDFNQPVTLETSKVINFNQMFKNTDYFNSPVVLSDTSKGTDFSSMFGFAKAFNQPINLNTILATKLPSFGGASKFNQPVTFNAPLVASIQGMFQDCTDFNSSVNITTGDALTNVSYMFAACSKLNSVVNISNTSHVTDFTQMFYGCSVFNQSVAFINTSASTTFANMFASCAKFNQPINFNSGNVLYMNSMLAGCSQLNSDITLDTHSCQNMASMFANCPVFNKPLNFNTSNVTTMATMFQNSGAFNQDISGWNTGNVTNMTSMFWATYFNQNLAAWDIKNVTTMATMFQSGHWSSANYSATLIGWAAQTVKSGVAFSAGTTKYSAGAAATARGVLTSAPNSWTITDGGQA